MTRQFTELQLHNLRSWITALRSGCYQQGRYALRIPRLLGLASRFCCHGVACMVVPPPNMAWRLENRLYELVDDVTGARLQGTPPLAWYRSTFGLTEHDVARLAELNDNGVDFRTIAMELITLAGIKELV